MFTYPKSFTWDADEEACDWCNNAMEDSIWALFNVNITNEMALDASDELSEILINHGDAGIAEAGGAFDKDIAEWITKLITKHIDDENWKPSEGCIEDLAEDIRNWVLHWPKWRGVNRETGEVNMAEVPAF